MLSAWLLSIFANTPAAAVEEYLPFWGRNCYEYEDFGGIDIDIDVTAPEHITVEECQARCELNKTCECVSYWPEVGKCWRRAQCRPNKFAQDHIYDTYVRASVCANETGCGNCPGYEWDNETEACVKMKPAPLPPTPPPPPMTATCGSNLKISDVAGSTFYETTFTHEAKSVLTPDPTSFWSNMKLPEEGNRKDPWLRLQFEAEQYVCHVRFLHQFPVLEYKLWISNQSGMVSKPDDTNSKVCSSGYIGSGGRWQNDLENSWFDTTLSCHEVGKYLTLQWLGDDTVNGADGRSAIVGSIMVDGIGPASCGGTAMLGSSICKGGGLDGWMVAFAILAVLVVVGGGWFAFARKGKADVDAALPTRAPDNAPFLPSAPPAGSAGAAGVSPEIARPDPFAGLDRTAKDITAEPLKALNPITGVLQAPDMNIEDAANHTGLVGMSECGQAARQIGSTAAAREQHGLTADEAGAFNLFTRESAFRHEMNRICRESDSATRAANLTPFLPAMKLMVTGRKKLPKFRGFAWRVVNNLDLRSTYTDGKIVWWWSWTSISRELDTCDTEADASARTQFLIEVFDAVDITPYSENSSDGEYLLAPGSKFVVKKTQDLGNNLFQIHLSQMHEMKTMIG